MKFHKILLMPKAQPLCTSAELTQRQRFVWSRKKKLLYCFAMQRGTQKLCVPTWENLVRSFTVNGSTVGLLRLGCMQGFPDGTVVKNPPANAGDTRETGLIPGSGRSPREGNGNPLQYSCLGNSMDRGAWWATVYGVAKSQTRLSD